jgi:hypothetical protein
MALKNGKYHWREHVWTKAELQLIKSKFHEMTTVQLAKELGIGIATVRKKCTELGFKHMEMEYWTDEQTILDKSVKGNTEGRYMQFICKGGPTVDLFMPQAADYYRQLAIRTGSADYSSFVIANGWRRIGWVGTPDGLRRILDCTETKSKTWWCWNPKPELPPEWKSEEEFFQWIQVPYVIPAKREVKKSVNIYHNYSKEIAEALSEMVANALQASFKKGWEKGYNDFNTNKSTTNYTYYSASAAVSVLGMKVKLKECISNSLSARADMCAGFKPTSADKLAAYENGIQDFMEWLEAQPLLAESKSSFSELSKTIDWIGRNADKINNHTWKIYQDQILDHVQSAKELISQLNTSRNETTK